MVSGALVPRVGMQNSKDRTATRIYDAKSRNLRFARLLPTSSTERGWKRTRSDIISKQRRNSASQSFIWFRSSRRSNGVTVVSAIRRQAIVCHPFNSSILRLNRSGSVMVGPLLKRVGLNLTLIRKKPLAGAPGYSSIHWPFLTSHRWPAA